MLSFTGLRSALVQSSDFSLPSSVHVSLLTIHVLTHYSHLNLAIKCQPPVVTYLKLMPWRVVVTFSSGWRPRVSKCSSVNICCQEFGFCPVGCWLCCLDLYDFGAVGDKELQSFVRKVSLTHAVRYVYIMPFAQIASQLVSCKSTRESKLFYIRNTDGRRLHPQLSVRALCMFPHPTACNAVGWAIVIISFSFALPHITWFLSSFARCNVDLLSFNVQGVS